MPTNKKSDAQSRVAENDFLSSLKDGVEETDVKDLSAVEEFGASLDKDDFFADDPKNILSASASASIDQLFVDKPKPVDASPKMPEKPKVKDEQPPKKGGVRFNNLEEAEKEVRKLQSERDRLSQRSHELEEAELLLTDIKGDPELAKALATYYQTGEFGSATAPSESTGDPLDEFGETDEFGDEKLMTKSQVKEALAKRERKAMAQKRLEDMKRVREQQWLDTQYAAFQASHPEVGPDDFQRVVQFAQDPKNVTLENIYTIMNIDEIVNARVKKGVEQMFRGRGREIPRASVVSHGGGDGSDEGAPRPIDDILKAAKNMRRFG